MLPHLWPYVSEYLHLQKAHADGGIRRLLRVFQANVRADRRYRPQRYPGKVTLFNTTHQVSTWSDIASGGVELHQIPGQHMNILRPPQVQILAKKLSACLSQATR